MKASFPQTSLVDVFVPFEIFIKQYQQISSRYVEITVKTECQ